MTELGPALHRWRDRITPAMVGLPDAQPRRAVGLRREELAQLAGVSVDYLTRLEQGRATRPSTQVVTSLARALRLSPQERDHLFLLAGQTPPPAGLVPTYLPAGVQRLLDRLSDTPVSVYDAAWTQLTCNRRWAGLLGELLGGTGRERNVAWRHFTGGPSRVSHTPEGETAFATAMVADLRTAAARYPDDAQLRSLVQDLRGASLRFADLWDSYVVAAHESSRKTIHHPEVGTLTLDCDVLTVPGSDLRIVAYTAEPGSDAAERLALIAVLGTVPAV
jgi:transcriptional regulator with XRE-family HTH domain